MHEHCNCNHNLKFCPICNIVYCTKCKQEWKQYPYYYTITYPWYWSSSTVYNDDGSITSCHHVT